MKGFAMLGAGKTGWIEKARPTCGALDAIVRPIAVSPCTSDVHTVWEGALGERKDMILGHEAVGEVVEVGSLVRDFKTGDRVIVTAITPDWGSEEAQRGYAMHSGGMLAGWKFSNFKDGVFAEFFHVNEADANLARLPEDMEPGAAAMLCDMMPTGLHAAELAEVQFGEDVAGKSIIMVSEELPELIGMSDRILIMKDGQLTAEIGHEEGVTEMMLIEKMV